MKTANRLKKWGFWILVVALFWYGGTKGLTQWDPIPNWKFKTYPDLEPIAWALAAVGVIILIVSFVAYNREITRARNHLQTVRDVYRAFHLNRPQGREGRQ